MNQPQKPTYNEKSIGIKSLIGQKILSAFINPEKTAVLLKTNNGDFYLKWEGECCAECYIAHVNGADLLVGSTILSAENTEWTSISSEEEYMALETMGTKFITTKGYVDIETRLSHNGYYSGEITVSKKGFIGSYMCLVNLKDVTEPLKDF
jgi:hypothetical protein